MASKGVSALKFVGTVSLGLLTGLSYSLSTQTVPTLLTLPSAATCARAFQTLTTSARSHLRALASVSSTAFMLAFILSPRPYRHPYLLYTSILVLGSRLATTELLAPYLYRQPSIPATAATTSSPRANKRRTNPPRRMEASYEVLPSSSDVHSEGTGGSISGEEGEEDTHADAQNINGEEVRAKVEDFLKKQVVQTAVAGLGFLVAIIGIWGDGVAHETLIIQI